MKRTAAFLLAAIGGLVAMAFVLSPARRTRDRLERSGPMRGKSREDLVDLLGDPDVSQVDDDGSEKLSWEKRFSWGFGPLLRREDVCRVDVTIRGNVCEDYKIAYTSTGGE